MVKIFQGDYRAVEDDINSWIEVYKPDIQDMKQSTVFFEKEHKVLLCITFLYEPTTEDLRVQYSIHKAPK